MHTNFYTFILFLEESFKFNPRILILKKIKKQKKIS